jgi:ribonuclease HIII
MATKKITITPSRQKEFAKSLKAMNFKFFANEYAFWRAKSNDVSIIFYKNGSVLFQGSESAIKNIFPDTGGILSHEQIDLSIEYPVMGLDESGKGDYFGPLVLAAAILDRKSENEAVRDGVMDSKKLTDKSVRMIQSLIKDKIIHKIRVIEPAEYNNIYKGYGNLNLLMISEYMKLTGSFDALSYRSIILDKFSKSREQNNSFMKSKRVNIIIVEKAEIYPAVAAASIFARFHFIEWIEKKSAELGITLPTGSGRAASDLYLKLKSKMSPREFEGIAKSHFKASG